MEYKEYIMEQIRQNLSLEADDNSKDDFINNMPKSEVLNRLCNWNGLINYGSTIRTMFMCYKCHSVSCLIAPLNEYAKCPVCEGKLVPFQEGFIQLVREAKRRQNVFKAFSSVNLLTKTISYYLN